MTDRSAQKPEPAQPGPWRLSVLLQGALIALAAFWIYSPAVRGGWLWDDETDITRNPILRDPAGLRAIWFAPAGLDYYPLKDSVQWLQWQLWGDHTLGYHLTNVCLLIGAAFLFWRLLDKLGVKHPWLGGLLLVVHPLVVESVAWIAELKNALSLPLLLLAFLAFVESGRRTNGSVGGAAGGAGSTGCLIASVLWFLAAILSKSSVVMFPCAVLLYLLWRRRGISRGEVAAVAALFAISAAFGGVTYGMQQHRSIGAEPIALGGALDRFVLAGRIALFYFSKSVFPFGLIPIYPRWRVDAGSAVDFLPWIGFVALGVFFWTQRAGWGRHALFGLGWFFLNLAPVLGAVPISFMAFTWVMDHLAYVSLLGVVGLAAACAGAGIDRLSRSARSTAIAFGVGLCSLLGWQSRAYAAHFHSSEELWRFTLSRNPAAWMAHYDLGVVLHDAGRKAEAMDEYKEALRLNPRYALGHKNLGLLLVESDRLPEAIAEYREALRLAPNDAESRSELADAHNRMGMALRAAGRTDEAVAEYREASVLEPGLPEYPSNLGTALAIGGRLPEAIAAFAAAVKLKPDWPQAHSNLGLALAKSGRVGDAIVQYKEALRLDPRLYEARLNLGNALIAIGQEAAGRAELNEAARLAAERAGHGG